MGKQGYHRRDVLLFASHHLMIVSFPEGRRGRIFPCIYMDDADRLGKLAVFSCINEMAAYPATKSIVLSSFKASPEASILLAGEAPYDIDVFGTQTGSKHPATVCNVL